MPTTSSALDTNIEDRAMWGEMRYLAPLTCGAGFANRNDMPDNE
jgi:hypothetical protein